MPGQSDAAEIFAARGDSVEINRRAEIDDDARAAVFVERGDAVDDAVGADFLRVVVVHGHAGLDAGLDEERFVAEVTLGHSARVEFSGGTTELMMTPPISPRLEIGESEEIRA